MRAAEEEGKYQGQWEPLIQIITILHAGCDNNVELWQYVKTDIICNLACLINYVDRKGSNICSPIHLSAKMIERQFGGIYSSNLGKSKEQFRLYIVFPKLIYSVLEKKSEKTIAE